ncbi:hypothetical protein KIN20_035679 [Parelaphostrongylus tenuis]|uniref:CMP/dCMP-type deaminase domain-containing protein n=1 Tax=Parelaphostrongylus tenuis TaxID=148309 RepID=A0AAD5WL28_PARTN|nr:hypothetical protein KIN20_035679 [Parelaphostrongylus tenuis]
MNCDDGRHSYVEVTTPSTFQLNRTCHIYDQLWPTTSSSFKSKGLDEGLLDLLICQNQNEKHHEHMNIVVKEACDGVEQGDGGPIGAAIVRDGNVIATGHNMILVTNDPTLHAEVVAIINACKKIGTYMHRSKRIVLQTTMLLRKSHSHRINCAQASQQSTLD